MQFGDSQHGPAAAVFGGPGLRAPDDAPGPQALAARNGVAKTVLPVNGAVPAQIRFPAGGAIGEFKITESIAEIDELAYRPYFLQ